MKKLTAVLLALTLAATLVACEQTNTPGVGTSAGGASPQTGHVIGLRPAETRDPSETFEFTFPADTDPVVGPDTGDETDPPVGVRTMAGTVIKFPYGVSSENILAVEIVSLDCYTVMLLYTEQADSYKVGDTVSFSYDEKDGLVEDAYYAPVWAPLDIKKTTLTPLDGAMEGTVVMSPYEWTDENMLAVRVWVAGEEKIMMVYTERASEFCEWDTVWLEYNPTGRPKVLYGDVPVWEALGIELIQDIAVPEKPVIYLYPETPTEVSVKLDLDGELTCTYPAYGEGWNNFTAHPDGTLVFPDGKEYYCLYWEGIQNTEWDFSKGFCVKGSDTAAFLEWALAEQGLTPREANEFIIYWLPRMESNPYNVISFQTEAYTDGAVLDVTPSPDTLLRVFMAYYPSDVEVEIEPQVFEPVERRGFTVVEWGGCEATGRR